MVQSLYALGRLLGYLDINKVSFIPKHNALHKE